MADLISKLEIPQSPATQIPSQLQDLFGVAKLKGNDTEFLYFKNEVAVDPGTDYRFSIASINIPKDFQFIDVSRGPNLNTPNDIQLSVNSALTDSFTGAVLLHLRDAALPLIKDLQHLCAEGIAYVGGKICARLTTASRIVGFLVNGRFYVLNDLHTDTFVYSHITSQGEGDFKTHMFNWFKTIEMRTSGEALAVGVEYKLECYDADEIFWAEGVDLWLVENNMRRNHLNQTPQSKPPQNDFSTPHYRKP
ncbi:MAG: hypothetical protein JNL02_18370 [Saprospiraceae bacterium]|nr:hypothetical protein [Saprospiraceae bacterium]